MVVPAARPARSRRRSAGRPRPASGRAAPGTARGAGARRPSTAPVARPIARHGLNARNTSPNSSDANTSPTQKMIMMNGGREVVVAVDVARRSRPTITTTSSATPIAPHTMSTTRLPSARPSPHGSGRHGGVLQLRLRPQHRERGERDDEHGGRRPGEQPLRDRQVRRWLSPLCANAVAGAASAARRSAWRRG